MNTNIQCFFCWEKLNQNLKCSGCGAVYKEDKKEKDTIILDDKHPDTTKACKELMGE